MSFFSFFNNKQEELSILLDIGNGSINGAIALFTRDKLPKIYFTTEVPFSIPLQANAEGLSSEMEVLLDQIIAYLIKTGLKQSGLGESRKIEKVLITFSSPWFAIKTKHLNLKQDTSFLVSRDFLKDLIEKEEQSFKKELMGDDADISYKVVEKSIVHTKINGYELQDTLDRKTKNFDAYLCLSVIGKSTIDIVEKVILKNMHISLDRTHIHTFPVASFIVIRDIFSANENFVIMDITAEVTDMTLVEDNVVIKSISIPSGKNFIIRQIAKKFDTSTEIAESKLRLYVEEKLDPETTTHVQEILLDVEKEWSIYLDNAVQELAPQKSIPSTVYLTVDSDVAPIYKDFLSLIKADATADFRKNMNLIRLDENTLSHFCETQKGVYINEFVTILAIFFNKIFQAK